ncbi:hypothetical protein EZV62_027264 [Acer yangbiense]|uniref:hAT-like transposase RNase-H fold domain-containing protein n=1 Tax=Acer yangbiense TaxID=1000413 RepID=A0A5C7GTT0_9ROSI|nr:hypothetical protein EZV62_027264 [Acer yangbiense]
MSNSDKNVTGSSCLTLTTQHFDNDCSRSELARMIVMHDYPPSMVEHEGFKDFCLVAITSDMWTTTNQKKGYMTITAHFIDESWHLPHRLSRFLYVSCPHTAENLSNPLLNCILDWTIDRKLSTLTLDNCSTNNCMIDLMLDKLVPSSLIMYGQLFHMKCATHILNLIMKNGLDVIDCGVEKIRDSVAFWTATPKRMEKFEEATRQLNLDYGKSYVEISNMASNMISKFDQYWKDVHGVMAMASLLDPRFKLKLLEYFFPLIYGDDRALEEIANVRKLCEDIFKDYQSRVVLQVSNVDTSGISNSNVDFGSETESLDAFFSWNIEASTVNEKSEFDSYLEEKTLPGTHDFDGLCNVVDGVGDMLVDEENDLTEGSDVVDG